MEQRSTPDRVDMFPLLLGVLLVLWLFFLIRPPVLLFWHYGLGMGTDGSKATTSQNQSPSIASSPTPSVPQSLEEAWPKAPARDKSTRALEQVIEDSTRKERQDHGRTALSTDPKLQEVAGGHSWDMYKQGYMDHISPDGIGPQQRVNKQHRRLFGWAGENVALLDTLAGSAVQIGGRFVDMWMNSPGHRRNILSADYTHMAAGCYQEADSTGFTNQRCTQVFANVHAWAEDPVPERIPTGGKITVRLRPEGDGALPTRLMVANPLNGRASNAVDLQARGAIAVGELTLQGPAGVYSLQALVPDKANPNRYLIVPGPYTVVY